MKDRDEMDGLNLIGLGFQMLIVLFFLVCGISIYFGIDYPPNHNNSTHKEQTEKVNNKKETIKRLYKNAFNEKR